MTLTELPLVDSASSDVARAPVGDHLAREDRLGPDVVGDRGQDRRVLGQVDRAPCRQRRRRVAEVGDDVHRIGRRSAVAEREQRPAFVERRAQRRPRRRRARPRSRSASARAAPRCRRPSRAPSGARHRRPPRGRSPARRGTGRGSSTRRRRGPSSPRGPRAGRGARRTRARAPRARGRASRSAPGGRTGPRSAARTPTPRRRRRRRSSGSRASARAPSRRRSRPPARSRSRCRRARASRRRLALERGAFGDDAERRERALADDHGMDELDRDVAHVGAGARRASERDEPPAGREALGHAVAEAREALGLGVEERPGSRASVRPAPAATWPSDAAGRDAALTPPPPRAPPAPRATRATRRGPRRSAR